MPHAKNNGHQPYNCTVPEQKDGKAMWQIAKATGKLDLNSPYSYVLIATHFRHTSVVAKVENTVVGFASGYLVPTHPTQLFIWQVGVHPAHQGKGIAKHLILSILNREVCKKVTHLCATISPDNTASRALFRRIAKDLETEIQFSTGFSPEDFPTAHDPEDWMQVGPITRRSS